MLSRLFLRTEIERRELDGVLEHSKLPDSSSRLGLEREGDAETGRKRRLDSHRATDGSAHEMATEHAEEEEEEVKVVEEESDTIINVLTRKLNLRVTHVPAPCAHQVPHARQRKSPHDDEQAAKARPRRPNCQ